MSEKKYYVTRYDTRDKQKSYKCSERTNDTSDFVDPIYTGCCHQYSYEEAKQLVRTFNAKAHRRMMYDMEEVPTESDYSGWLFVGLLILLWWLF